jgi:hypothetical protein
VSPRPGKAPPFLDGSPDAPAPAAEKQRQFWMLRLALQDALSQFILFSEIVT